MTRSKTGNKLKTYQGGEGPGSWDFQDNAGLASFLTGESSSDFNAFLDMVKECGRYLNTFVPPEGFQIQAAAPPIVPSPEMIKAMGATSLNDFYELALEGEPRESLPIRNGSPPQFFPRGPETVRSALSSVEADIKRLTKSANALEHSWAEADSGPAPGGGRPGSRLGADKPSARIENRLEKLSDIRSSLVRIESRLETLSDVRANLVRAARLWARMKEAAAGWPPEAKRLLSRAQRLTESADLVLRNVRNGDDDDGPSAGRSRRGLTKVAGELRLTVEAAKAVTEDGFRWNKNMDRLSADFDDFLAGIMDGETRRQSRDWNGEIRKLSARLTDLEREERRLKDESARLAEALTHGLSALAATETRLAGLQGRETLDRLESLGRGVRALLSSAIERRRDLARIYVILPHRLGRPVYLEKTFLAAALSLGRAQSVLEDLRHRLALASGRLSTTHRLRSEGEKLAERLSRPQRRGDLLKTARRRLGALARAVDQRLSLAETKGQLEEALAWGQKAEKELAQGRGQNSRLFRSLQAATLEKERLAQKLAEARQGLQEMGQLKARLIKVYTGKSELLERVDAERRLLLTENEALKAERQELRRKRSTLATMYTSERAELKRITAELRTGQSRLAEAEKTLAERRDLETRLDQTRREREDLDARRREIEATLQDQAARLVEASAKSESLSAELVRHREELAEASSARQSLGEQTAALRRRLDVMRQAHGSLLKTLDRKERELTESNSDRDRMSGRLTRQKKTILRLVTARQRLRSELGAARLKMNDLDDERRALSGKLDQALAEAGEAHRVRAELSERLTGLEAEKSALENRLVELEAEKTWLTGQNENLAGENSRLTDQVRNLADERDQLNSRLADQTRNLADERDLLNSRLAEQERNLADERDEINSRLAELARERETLTAQSRSLEEEKGGLAARVAELESRITDDLTPFIKILGQALWRSEAQLKRARTAGSRLVEEFKLESDVREANLRLRAAGREIELTETAQAEETRLKTILKEKTGQLDRAAETIQELGQAAASAANLRREVERQSLEIEDQRARLAELEPLVAGFINQGRQADPALAAYMAGENRVLNGDLAEDAGTPPANVARLQEQPGPEAADEGGQTVISAEIQSLVGFLARSFVQGVADLAEARRERSRLAEELTSAGTTREVLEESLSSREAELSEVRDQAYALSRERDQLHEALKDRNQENELLKSELAQADHDLAETDGRVEAAWAAINYLGSRAGDSLGAMRGKMENQARQVDSLTVELKSREEKIKSLESRQNQLALLYWLLIARLAPEAGQAQLSGLLATPPADQSARPENDSEKNGAENREDQAGQSGGHSLGRELLEGVKKVARRSLFTLLLTGSLVLSAGPLTGPAQASPGPVVETPVHLLSRLDSSYIGRSVSLEAVESSSRLAGPSAVENRLAQMVDEIARDQGLTNGEFLSLVRTARGPEHPVRLADFEGREGGLALLAAHFPKLTRHLSAWTEGALAPEILTRLMKLASDFKPLEGGFWERLFFDLLAESEPAPALDELMAHLERKQEIAARPRPEFAGRLAPFTQLENLGPDRFITFMSGHIKNSWPNLSGRGRDRAARRLAGDIYFAARFFGLPVTFLAPLAHQDAETGLIEFFRRGATASLHDRASDLADLAHSSALVWLEGRPPLCDLDEALAGQYKRPFVEAVYRKKNALILAVNKTLNADNTLLGGLDQGGED